MAVTLLQARAARSAPPPPGADASGRAPGSGGDRSGLVIERPELVDQPIVVDRPAAATTIRDGGW